MFLCKKKNIFNFLITGTRSCSDLNSKLVKDEKVTQLFDSLISGNRASLARSITLVESNLESKKQMGETILMKVMEHLKKNTAKQSFRIGLSGPPGAGKSTFIEAFGNFVIEKDHKVAVLAVDPSSKSTGGSLMGDKTRMPELTLNPKAYIRPSPSGGTLGGVARNTNEAITLCEGAGYDIILVETMGVGQSEFAVADMVDMFCLIIPPAGGDELQGLKRGIIEVSDMIVVNKFDGDLMASARRVAAEYTSALKFVRKRHAGWRPKVMKVSSLMKTGLDELWKEIEEFRNIQQGSGRLDELRRQQRIVWFWGHVKEALVREFETDSEIQRRMKEMEQRVKSGTLSPGIAADMLLKIFRKQ